MVKENQDRISFFSQLEFGVVLFGFFEDFVLEKGKKGGRKRVDLLYPSLKVCGGLCALHPFQEIQ